MIGKVYYHNTKNGNNVLIMNVEALAASRYCNKPIEKVLQADIANTALHLLTTNPAKNAGHSSFFRFERAGHHKMQDEDYVEFENENVRWISRGPSWHLERF